MKRRAPQEDEARECSKRSPKSTRLDHWLSSGVNSTPTVAPTAHPRTSKPGTQGRQPHENSKGLNPTNDEAAHPLHPTTSLQTITKATKRLQTTTEATKRPGTLTITEEKGDIFASPKDAILIHACNCEDRWGAGIALAFKKHYPKAYELYHQHCEMYKPDQGRLRGTALLIPPVDGGRGHHIGCLFTSFRVGVRKDSQKQILENTRRAMEDLLRQVGDLTHSQTLGGLRMCQINAGSFKVPWRSTVDVLEAIEITEDMPRNITVVTR